MRRQYTGTVILIFLFLPLIAGLSSVRARELHATVEGKDDPACGDLERPCRSISRAIANASDGDSILVGPGRYGDLNRDGDFRDPGEEAAERKFGCLCIINVHKSLTIESSAGAAETMIDADDRAPRAVRIQANDVSFGRAGKGLTVTGARGTGLVIAKHTRQVKVEGNFIKENWHAGVLVQGDSHLLLNNVVSGNRTYGFVIAPGEGHEIRRNLINNNKAGGIHTLTSKVLIADNTIEGNDPVRGCGLVNNSKARLLVSHNVWETTEKQENSSPNKICNLGGSRTTAAPTAGQ